MSFEGIFMESHFHLKSHDLNLPLCKMNFCLRRRDFWILAIHFVCIPRSRHVSGDDITLLYQNGSVLSLVLQYLKESP